MPSVFKLSPDAERVSRRLREGFGWYPTEKDNEFQLRLFEDVVSRVKQELKTAGVTPSNMRKNLKNINDISVAEGQNIWKKVKGDTHPDDQGEFSEVFTCVEACVSYAHAIAFALEACFDAYLKNQRNSASEQQRGQTHDDVQQRETNTTRSRSRDGDNYDWDGRAYRGGGGGRGGFRSERGGYAPHGEYAGHGSHGGAHGGAHGEYRGGYAGGKRY